MATLVYFILDGPYLTAFPLFTLLIWGTDLHCEARLSFSSLTPGMEDRVEMNHSR